MALVALLIPLSLAAFARAEVSAKDSPYNAAGNGIADDRAAIQSAIDSGDSLVRLPPGIYRITGTLYLGDSQTLRGDGISNAAGTRGTLIWLDNSSGVAIQVGGSPGFARHARVDWLRVRGNGATTSTTGIRLGDPSLYYSCNNFTWRDVLVESFGIGFDNHAADASKLIGGAIVYCGINGRTSSNDFLQVIAVSNMSALTYGWQIVSGGLDIKGGVSADQPCHLRAESGGIIKASGVWFELATGGTVAWCDGGTNSYFSFDLCHLMRGGSSIPFVRLAYGGWLKFSFMRGGLNMFEAYGSPIIIGEGEQGSLNGSPYTAGGYPVTP